MDVVSFLIFVAVILAVSIIAAYFPMTVKTTDHQVHMMIAFSAGVFLGILFLILLPEAIHESEGVYDVEIVLYVVLAGFLIMFAVDFLFKHLKKADCDCHECLDHHSHNITSLSAWVGLSIHASFDGLSLATAFIVGEEIGYMVLVALCLHKTVEVFSLSSMFLLTKKKRQAIFYLGIFCLLTPVAALISYFVFEGLESSITGLAFAFSAGVFIFVTMLHMIPEAFHRKQTNLGSLALLLLGFGMIVLVVILMGSSEL